jgi:hypothetical protein
LIAETTLARDPFPVEIFCAVMLPTLRPEVESVALTVPPVPEVRVTEVGEVADISVIVLLVPSTLMIPFTPLTADDIVERPRAVFAEPLPTCKVAAEPCSAVLRTSCPEEFTEAFRSPPEEEATAEASCWDV